MKKSSGEEGRRYPILTSNIQCALVCTHMHTPPRHASIHIQRKRKTSSEKLGLKESITIVGQP